MIFVICILQFSKLQLDSVLLNTLCKTIFVSYMLIQNIDTKVYCPQCWILGDIFNLLIQRTLFVYFFIRNRTISLNINY